MVLVEERNSQHRLLRAEKDKTELSNLAKWTLEQNDGICYVARTDEDLVGVVLGHLTPLESLSVDLLYVSPSYRGQGVGTRLLETLEQASGMATAMLYYNRQDLSSYYVARGYLPGEQLEIAIKKLT